MKLLCEKMWLIDVYGWGKIVGGWGCNVGGKRGLGWGCNWRQGQDQENWKRSGEKRKKSEENTAEGQNVFIQFKVKKKTKKQN